MIDPPMPDETLCRCCRFRPRAEGETTCEKCLTAIRAARHADPAHREPDPRHATVSLETEIRTRALEEVLRAVAGSLPPVWREKARMRILERRRELAGEVDDPQIRAALFAHLDALSEPFS